MPWSEAQAAPAAPPTFWTEGWGYCLAGNPSKISADTNVLPLKEISPSNTLDLYCGTGTIGIYVSKYTNHVLGIDCNQSNILDANKNKELNKVENIEFIASKVEDVIENIKDKYDLIIVDPPRAGLDPKTIKTIKEMSPINIIYVSCDPVTLMRDLNILKEHYNIVEITPFNMFPRTYHCESITVLERK